jgi:hypothetical protein
MDTPDFNYSARELLDSLVSIVKTQYMTLPIA